MPHRYLSDRPRKILMARLEVESVLTMNFCFFSIEVAVAAIS